MKSFEINKINHNTAVLFLKYGIVTNVTYLVMSLCLISLNSWGFEFSYIGLNFNQLKFFVLLCTILIVAFLFMKQFKEQHVIYYSKNDTIPKWTNLLDYYSNLLPWFFLTTSISIVTFGNYKLIFIAIWLIFYLIGSISLVLLLPLRHSYDSNLYYLINRTYDIFMLEIYQNPALLGDLPFIKFKEYFSKAITTLDMRLENGLKIGNLKTSEDLDLVSFISQYAPLYLKYAEQTQIEQFKDNLNLILNSVNQKEEITSLDVTKGIQNIYTDLDQFLLDHHYAIPKNSAKIRILSIFKKYLSHISFYAFLLFILLGLIKDFISFPILPTDIKTTTGIDYQSMIILIPPIIYLLTQVIQTLGNIYTNKTKKY